MYNRVIFRMRKNSIKFLFLSFFFLFLGCNTPEKKGANATKGKSKYSQWLSYAKTEDGIKLFIKDPDNTSRTRILLCTAHPERVSSSSRAMDVLDVSNIKVATNAATHVGMLVALYARNNIGAVSMGKYLHDPTLKKRFDKGRLLELGSTSIPFESLSKQHINVWVSAGMEPLDQANEERFKALGIQWIPNYDWREEHPLGKAEWLLFFGAITNHFDEAVAQFDAICKRYHAYDALPKGNQCKKILVGNFAGDFWYTPLQQSFQAQFFSQVDFCTFSMNYKGTGSMAVGAERIYQEAEACELWLNPGFPTKQAILNAFTKANQLRPFNQGSIFCYAHDLNKFWEQSALKPDIVLRDLIRIKQGNTAKSKLYFYREVK